MERRTGTNSFSTSSAAYVKSKKQKKELERQKAKAYEAKRQTKEAAKVRMKPDPILGYSTQMSKDYLRWENCELNGLILKNEDVWAGKASLPGQSSDHALLNFGLNDDQTQKLILFDGLPQMNKILTLKNQPFLDPSSLEHEQLQNDAELSELEKKNKLLRIFDLRNSNTKGIDKFIKHRITKAFSPKNSYRPDKLDPGCSEVQAAIITYRIHAVLKHAWENGRDKDSKRHLSDLVMKRMKILKYLRRTAPERYLDLLPRIGLEPKYLNDELIVRAKLPLRPGESLD